MFSFAIRARILRGFLGTATRVFSDSSEDESISKERKRERERERKLERIRQESRNNRWRMFLEGGPRWRWRMGAWLLGGSFLERKKKKEKKREKKSCSPIEAPFLSIHSSCPSPALSISFHRDTKIVSSGPTELEGFLSPTKGCSTSQWQRTQNGVLIQEHPSNGHTRKMH